MMKTAAASLILLCSGAITRLAHCQDVGAAKQQYALRLEQGKSYMFTTSTERTINRAGMGQNQQIERNSTVQSQLDVQETDADGSLWVRYTYKTASLRYSGEGITVSYDSTRDKKVHPIAIPFAVLLDQSFYIKLTPQGKALKINGLDMIVANLRAKLAAVPGGQSIHESMKLQLTEPVVREDLESFLAVFPPSPVGIGDSWSSPVTAAGSGLATTTWHVSSRNAGTVIFDVNVVIEPDPNSPQVKTPAGAVKWSASGQGHGQIDIDETTGRIIRSNLSRDTTELAYPVPAQGLRRREGPSISVKTRTVSRCAMTELPSGPASTAVEPNATLR